MYSSTKFAPSSPQWERAEAVRKVHGFIVEFLAEGRISGYHGIQEVLQACTNKPKDRKALEEELYNLYSSYVGKTIVSPQGDEWEVLGVRAPHSQFDPWRAPLYGEFKVKFANPGGIPQESYLWECPWMLIQGCYFK